MCGNTRCGCPTQGPPGEVGPQGHPGDSLTNYLFLKCK